MQLGNVLYFLISAGLFFVMMRYGCGAHIMGHGHHHGATASDNQRNDRNFLAPPDQAVDPVCGMTVKTAGARSTVHGGRAYFFCSQTCREKFEATPTSYVKSAMA